MKPPPPRLPADGCVTAKANPTATAASTALPPALSTLAPTWEANGERDATTPCSPRTTCACVVVATAPPAATLAANANTAAIHLTVLYMKHSGLSLSAMPTIHGTSRQQASLATAPGWARGQSPPMTTNPSPTLLRQLALRHQGLAGKRKIGSGLAGAQKALEQIAYVQIDTISVVARAHHHTFFTPRWQIRRRPPEPPRAAGQGIRVLEPCGGLPADA